jgi:mRNA interferase MazF
VPLTTNLKWANAPGNVVLRAINTGLDRDSVAIAWQTAALDRAPFLEQAGQIGMPQLHQIMRGIDTVLGR